MYVCTLREIFLPAFLSSNLSSFGPNADFCRCFCSFSLLAGYELEKWEYKMIVEYLITPIKAD